VVTVPVAPARKKKAAAPGTARPAAPSAGIPNVLTSGSVHYTMTHKIKIFGRLLRPLYLFFFFCLLHRLSSLKFSFFSLFFFICSSRTFGTQHYL
jgi:hypothetical protein